MELTNFFEIQKGLKEHIGYKGKDKFPKMMLAMLVEFMECANDWRGFKYWSENPKPKETSLEEYVDGFHFVLETGLDMLGNGDIRILPKYAAVYQSRYEKGDTQIIRQYKQLTHTVLYIDREAEVGASYLDAEYGELIEQYLYLGSLLGFTEEQIEQAYMEKNEVNHQRQESGY
ncbi:dUTP diphosphatase [Bacillus mycoides]|uniref:dUTP diphosphatase n=1 Tax=Bacillus mycoides TaxID=1405 RepID=UPI0029313939|nr:dUTP diphosphatase [Bacillus mycoides]WOA61041.1 dUTP diphosphatase [Bacillus mycoides]